MFAHFLRAMGAAHGFHKSHRQHAALQATGTDWTYFGLGVLTGGSAELAAHLETNVCINDIAAASTDIYMLVYTFLANDTGNFVSIETAPYVLSLLYTVQNIQCGRLANPDAINTDTTGETTVTDVTVEGEPEPGTIEFQEEPASNEP